MNKMALLLLGVAFLPGPWQQPASSQTTAADAPAATRADGVPPEYTIEARIADLGASRFDKREEAVAALRRAGLAALPALEKAAASDDPEIAVRARDLVADIKLGIQPDWPAEITLLVRHYKGVAAAERVATITRVSDALGDKAGPFLLNCLVEGNDNEAAAAAARLMQIGGDAVYRQVAARIAKPGNIHQARVLGWALSKSGKPMEALAVYAEAGITDGSRNELLLAGLKKIRDDLEARRFAEAARIADGLAAAIPAESRAVYLKAEAMIALGRDDEAAQLRDRALAMNPNNKPAHFSAGEMLMEMGRRVLAAREWEAMLKMPPAEDVYSANALLRLASIHESCRLYAKAAEYYGRSIDVIDKMRGEHGGGIGLIGATPEELRLRANALEAKGLAAPPPANAVIRDLLDDDQLAINLAIDIKDNRAEELRRALARVQASLTVRVQPAGLRIFDKAPAAIQYDRQGQKFWVTINGQRASEPTAFRLKGEQADIAVSCEDCCYIFSLDVKTGQSQRVARFEKDYTLGIKPGRRLAGLTGPTLTLNGKARTWDELAKGINSDLLPEGIELVLSATTPAGQPFNRTFNIACKEPAIERLLPPLTTRPGQPPPAPEPEEPTPTTSTGEAGGD